MQYRTLALAFAATAFAQTDLNEVVSVLVTALPSSLISEYETNSAAVASEISSAFEAGNTPSWFEALPTAVQTYLIPVVETGNVTSMQSSVSGAPTVIVNSTANSTLATTRRTPTVTSTTSSSDSSETTGSNSGDASSTSDSSSETSTAGASVPTAIVGMGLAGAAGLVGLLAL